MEENSKVSLMLFENFENKCDDFGFIGYYYLILKLLKEKFTF